MIVFPPFRLDPLEQQLWRGDALVHIKPMAFAVLRQLLDHAGHLLTRQELFARFWGDVCIGQGVLKTHVGEIRQALGDRARRPRFIETVHGRGYRFIGRIECLDAADAASQVSLAKTPRATPPSHPHLAGRQVELGFLKTCWAKARRGERQVVFVTGEPGIGKSALVSAFLHERLKTEPDLPIAWGQCVEQCGPAEPFLPIIEAIRRRCGEPGGDRVTTPYSTAAPPGRDRQLGPMTELLEARSAPSGMVLLLEDLHWADSATLDLLAYVAQRSDPARLLILGTYRPLEASASRLADIEQTLRARHLCAMLPVPNLSQPSVRAYLDRRFSGHRLPRALPALLHQRSDGNALFMTGLADEWLARGLLATSDGTCELVASLEELGHCVPDSFVRMIHRALERVSPLERNVLEAASVACNGFETAAVAAALSLPAVLVEDICMRWAHRGQFFRSTGKVEWPDGTITEGCEFLHAIYRQVIFEQIGAARQAQLHLGTGERLEAAHAEHAHTIAAELAVHFHKGRDYRRAVRYLQISGEQALRRGEHEAALAHLTLGLELSAKLPRAEGTFGIERELRRLLAAPSPRIRLRQAARGAPEHGARRGVHC